MTLVVDASAIAAVLFDEPDGATVRTHCRGETLLAPQLLDYELATAATKRIRRGGAEAATTLALLQRLQDLRIDRVPVRPGATVVLAQQTGLSAYDAAYLWLAITRDAELVTLDRRLARVNAAIRGD